MPDRASAIPFPKCELAVFPRPDMQLSDSEDEFVVLARNEDTPQQQQQLSNPRRSCGSPYKPENIMDIVIRLQTANVPCFLAGTQALRYFGAKLVQTFCVFAVPHNSHDRAVEVLSSHSDLTLDTSFSPWSSSGPSLNYPCFCLNETSLRILIVPDRAWGLQCLPGNLEVDEGTSIPYPSASHFAQSLLKTRDVNALELFVDGQDSSLEWGYESLEFGQHSWKNATWEKTVREKEKRIPLEKPKRLYATRFRRRKVASAA